MYCSTTISLPKVFFVLFCFFRSETAACLRKTFRSNEPLSSSRNYKALLELLLFFPYWEIKKAFFQQSFVDYANVWSTEVKTFTIFNTAGLKKLSDNAKRPIAIMLNDQLYTVAKRQRAISKRKRWWKLIFIQMTVSKQAVFIINTLAWNSPSKKSDLMKNTH